MSNFFNLPIDLKKKELMPINKTFDVMITHREKICNLTLLMQIQHTSINQLSKKQKQKLINTYNLLLVTTTIQKVKRTWERKVNFKTKNGNLVLPVKRKIKRTVYKAFDRSAFVWMTLYEEKVSVYYKRAKNTRF